MSKPLYQMTERERKISQLLIDLAASNYKHPKLEQASILLDIPISQILPYPKEVVKSKSNSLAFQHMEARRKAKLAILADCMLELETPVHNKTNSLTVPDQLAINPMERQNRVLKNKREIEKKHARRMKSIEEHIHNKRPIISEEKLAQNELRKQKSLDRDDKIKRIAEEKRRNNREREISAMNHDWTSSSFEDTRRTPQKAFVYVRPDPQSVEQQLESINHRLKTAEQRNERFLLSKACGSILNDSSAEKAYFKKQEMKTAENKHWVESILKIRDKQERSKDNRLKIRSEEHERLSQSSTGIQTRKKYEWKDFKKIETQLREKEDRIKKIKEHISEEYRKKSITIAKNYQLKKTDVDFRLTKWKAIEHMKKSRMLKRFYSSCSSH